MNVVTKGKCDITCKCDECGSEFAILNFDCDSEDNILYIMTACDLRKEEVVFTENTYLFGCPVCGIGWGITRKFKKSNQGKP